MPIAAHIILWAAVALVLIPALAGWVLIFGRHRERTAASSRLEGTYYEPYAKEMRDAEERLLRDPALRRVETEAGDGVRLCADLLPGGDDRAVLLIHGFMTAPTKNFGVIAETYRAAGYTVLMAHLRAHGPSGGRHGGLQRRGQRQLGLRLHRRGL